MNQWKSQYALLTLTLKRPKYNECVQQTMLFPFAHIQITSYIYGSIIKIWILKGSKERNELL